LLAAASSVSYDLHDKLRVYRRNEVREYVVWRVQDRAIDWFALRDDRYERLALDADGQRQQPAGP
jgi:Uma2 family endonuclease